MKNKSKSLVVHLVASILSAILICLPVLATDTNSIGATVTPQSISIVVTSNGVVPYGTVSLSGSQTSMGVSATQSAVNNGNITEKFNIKTSNATSSGGTWTVNSATGTEDIYTHDFSTTTGSIWMRWTGPDTYAAATGSIPVNATTTIDLRIGVPSSVSEYSAKTISVTIQATTP
ncbi:MAG: hypothetical protein Q7R99_03135 [bacterium]|nr:hypothetical protein [bacterium]